MMLRTSRGHLWAFADEDLMRRADRGDARAFGVIFDRRRVRGALEGLPAGQRRVIELACFGGFTHTQIADMLELPAGTVKGRIRLGLTRMRLSLGELAVGGGVS